MAVGCWFPPKFPNSGTLLCLPAGVHTHGSAGSGRAWDRSETGGHAALGVPLPVVYLVIPDTSFAPGRMVLAVGAKLLSCVRSPSGRGSCLWLRLRPRPGSRLPAALLTSLAYDGSGRLLLERDRGRDGGGVGGRGGAERGRGGGGVGTWAADELITGCPSHPTTDTDKHKHRIL